MPAVRTGMDIETNKIVVVAFTTLDGVVEDPDGSWETPVGGWGLRHGAQAFAGDRFRLGPTLDTGALLFGRRTWQVFAQRWPARSGPFADAMNHARKYVASRTLASVEGWSNSVLLDAELLDAVEHLRDEHDVAVVGSTSIAHQLAAHDLVDEYRLVVLPSVIGSGERLFAAGRSAELVLAAHEVGDPGLLLRYEVVHGRSGGNGADA